MLKILFIGDVVGQPGCEFLRRHLPSVKRLTGADIRLIPCKWGEFRSWEWDSPFIG